MGPEAYGHSCLFFLPELGLGDLSLCMSYLGGPEQWEFASQLGRLCYLAIAEPRVQRGFGYHPGSILELGG